MRPVMGMGQVNPKGLFGSQVEQQTTYKVCVLCFLPRPLIRSLRSRLFRIWESGVNISEPRRGKCCWTPVMRLGWSAGVRGGYLVAAFETHVKLFDFGFRAFLGGIHLEVDLQTGFRIHLDYPCDALNPPTVTCAQLLSNMLFL